MCARSVSSAQYRDRGLKMSARPKAAGQASPRNESDEIHPRAPELRARREKNRTRTKRSFHPHAQKRASRTRTKSRTRMERRSFHPHARARRTAHVRLLYNPRMQISGSQKPGGRSHARPLVGRKGGREPPWIQTFAYGSAFPLTKGLEGDSAALLGDDGPQEVEEER